jgi:hypothetical protein
VVHLRHMFIFFFSEKNMSSARHIISSTLLIMLSARLIISSAWLSIYPSIHPSIFLSFFLSFFIYLPKGWGPNFWADIMPFQIVSKTQNDKNKLIIRCLSITPHDQYNAKGLGIYADTRYSPAPFLKNIVILLFIQKPELLT